MTAFDLNNNIVQVEDPAYNLCRGEILVNASSDAQILSLVTTSSAPKGASGVSPACFNGQEVLFQADTSPAMRPRYDKSYIKITYEAKNIVNGLPDQAIDPNEVSIPWNTIAATLATAKYSLNAGNIDVENLNSTFADGNMIKLLTTYSRDALEGNDDRFFTPCIEEKRDVLAELSGASQARAQAWLTNGTNIIRGSKIIMLGDLFDSMIVEAAWYTTRMLLTLRFKEPNDILFVTAAGRNNAINHFYITNVELYLCKDYITEEQIAIDRSWIESNSSIMRNAYRVFDSTPTILQGSINYQQPSIKNLQAAVASISSTRAADKIGINPYQYCYGAETGILGNTGITGYQQQYEKYVVPVNQVRVSGTNKKTNTELFEQWKLLTKLINVRNGAPVLQFGTSMGILNDNNKSDLNPYVFFTSVFGNPDAAARKLVSGAVHEVRMDCDHNVAQSVTITRIRMAAVEIMGSTDIRLLN